MRAIIASTAGDPEVLRVVERAEPPLADDEVRITVTAAGVNRADLLQRQGLYPPPAGSSDVLGLECSGVVTEVGPSVNDHNLGDQVCALLTAGGYATTVVAPAAHVLPVPEGVDPVAAAAFPEAVVTAWLNLVEVGRLAAGETVLIHGASGGVGSIAVQLAVQLGATVLATASGAKLDFVKSLGATEVIDYRDQDFSDHVRKCGGADVILDVIGAKYLPANIAALKLGGRLVVIGLQGGRMAELDLARLLSKQATVAGTTLRSRSRQQKGALVAAVSSGVWPLVTAGAIKAFVDRTFTFEQAAQAHTYLESGQVRGKVLLIP